MSIFHMHTCLYMCLHRNSNSLDYKNFQYIPEERSGAPEWWTSPVLLMPHWTCISKTKRKHACNQQLATIKFQKRFLKSMFLVTPNNRLFKNPKKKNILYILNIKGSTILIQHYYCFNLIIWRYVYIIYLTNIQFFILNLMKVLFYVLMVNMMHSFLITVETCYLKVVSLDISK